MRWITTSFGLALLALIVALFLVATLATVFRFGIFQLLFFIVPGIIGYIVGRTYRHGMTLGAPGSRLLLLGLVLSGMIVGAFSVYLGYSTVSWILHRGEAGPSFPGYWWYLASPSEVRPLVAVLGQGDQNGFEVNLHFACGLGAVVGLIGVAAGLRDPGSQAISSAADPAAFLDHTVVDTDSSLGQRLAGLLLVLVAAGALVLVWRAPGREGFSVPGGIVPVVLVFGLGLLARPSRPATWITIAVLGLAAGCLNGWLLTRF